VLSDSEQSPRLPTLFFQCEQDGSCAAREAVKAAAAGRGRTAAALVNMTRPRGHSNRRNHSEGTDTGAGAVTNTWLTCTFGISPSLDEDTKINIEPIT